MAILSSDVHANVGEGEIEAALGSIQKDHCNIDISSYPQDKDSTLSDYRVVFSVRRTDQAEIDSVYTKILIACEAGCYEAIRILQT